MSLPALRVVRCSYFQTTLTTSWMLFLISFICVGDVRCPLVSMTQVDSDACSVLYLAFAMMISAECFMKSASFTCRLVSLRSIGVDLRTTSRASGQRMVSPSRLATLDFTAWRVCFRDEGRRGFALAVARLRGNGACHQLVECSLNIKEKSCCQSTSGNTQR